MLTAPRMAAPCQWHPLLIQLRLFSTWQSSNSITQHPSMHGPAYAVSEAVDVVLGLPCRIRVDSFPVGTKLMNELMAVVIQEANRVPALRERLFQVGGGHRMAGSVGDCQTWISSSSRHSTWEGLKYLYAATLSSGSLLLQEHLLRFCLCISLVPLLTCPASPWPGQLPHGAERGQHGDPAVPQEAGRPVEAGGAVVRQWWVGQAPAQGGARCCSP
jgi:hypothetical protein